jgi:cellular nucleic acid-binding protein
VLRLKGGKYYVGKATNIPTRVQQHFEGKGSSWTRSYKPISVEKTIMNVSPFEEDKITKEYMAKYGIENVRGGSYVQEELDVQQLDALQTEIWAAKDCCTRCGRSGHFVKDCYAKTTVTENVRMQEEILSMRSNTINCYRCGRPGHYSSQCYASRDVYGDDIDDDDDEDDDDEEDEDEDDY